MLKNKLKNIGLYFITDAGLSKKDIFEDVKAAIKGGVRIVQYREKNKTKEEMVEEAKKIKIICMQNDVLFLINDSVDIALEVGADGVHLGLDDISYEKARKLLGNEKIIGLTAHNMEEAIEFEKLGADYLGVSPIFETTTKRDAGRAMGLEKFKEIVNSVSIPCIGIGGINEENMEEVMKAGADGVAMISAIVTKDDVEETVRGIIDKIKSIKK
jgi:thiamine-phosphate pyrophosphorylase